MFHSVMMIIGELSKWKLQFVSRHKYLRPLKQSFNQVYDLIAYFSGFVLHFRE